jgi:signal transduction histidine kinase
MSRGFLCEYDARTRRDLYGQRVRPLRASVNRLSPVTWLRRHPFAADAMLAAGLAALTVAVLWLAQGEAELRTGVDPRDPDALGVLLAIGSAAPVAWRRRAPLEMLVLAGAFSITLNAVGYPEQALGVLVGVYSAAAYCGRRRSRLALVFVLLGTIVALVLAPGGVTFPVFVSNYVIFITAWAIGDNLQTRRRYVAELEQKASRLEAEREQSAQRAVSEERSRIARELHDVVAHNVSVMVVQAGAARRTLGRDPVRAATVLEAIEGTGRQALAEMRRLLGVLRTDDEATASLLPQPGVARLDELIENVRAAGLPVELTVEGEPVPLPAGVELSAYRIVQEALTNSLKHGGRAHAAVRLRYTGGGLEVSVTDDGRGLAATPVSGGGTVGHGLVGMRERVALFGGDLRAGPRRGGGYEVVATLPVESRPA